MAQLPKNLDDAAMDRLMRGLSPDALRALHAVSEMRNRPPEDVLRDEIRRYIEDKLPPVDVAGIIHAMADRFYQLGYFCGTAKRLLREWNQRS